MRGHLALLCLLAATLAGCSGPQRDTPIEVWTDMRRDGKPVTQGDKRRPVENTVARGHLQEDDAYALGTIDNGTMYTGANPLPLNAETMTLGQAKFNTYCSPCHSRVGDGKGIVAIKTPSWQPANLHEARIKEMADGEIFSTISDGKRSMPGYHFQIPEHDRWAIVAYVRALQRTTSGTLADVPGSLRAGLK